MSDHHEPKAADPNVRLGVLLSAETLAKRISELGAQITRDYAGKQNLCLVGILKGSFVFLSDLMRRLSCDLEVDFISTSSYGQATVSSGTVRLLKDLDRDVAGRHILVAEDIVDSGLTLAYIWKSLAARDPASLSVVALLDKKERRSGWIVLDYVGFKVPDVFLVGYGLDCAERYRGLPYVAAMGSRDGDGPA